MTLSSRLLLVIGAAFALMLAFGTPANTVPFNGPFWRHHYVENYGCVFRHWVCWEEIWPGSVDESLCATADHIGNIDADIADESRVHFVFHCDFGVSGDSVDVVPVDSTIVMSPEVSRALGYETVTLLPGWYPVNYSHYAYGETWIDAILTGPTANAKGTWGKIKSSYR